MYIGMVITLLYITAVTIQVCIYNGPLATSSFPVRKSQSGTVPFRRTFQPSISLLYFHLAPRTRARFRVEASEASNSLPVPRSARPYSAAQDKALRKLVVRGLAWEEIEEFDLLFAKRTLRSLQMRSCGSW
jgi:hypothetical protein